jgi:hypothetical protein
LCRAADREIWKPRVQITPLAHFIHKIGQTFAQAKADGTFCLQKVTDVLQQQNEDGTFYS